MEEKLGRGSFGSGYKADFKEGPVAIEQFIRNKWNEAGGKFLKQAKIFGSLNHPDILNLKKCMLPATRHYV